MGLLLLRRSVGLAGMPALLTLAMLHIFGRARPWVHEWLWSIYQFNFVTVLVGPVVAGLAAWEGARLARHRSLYLVSDRLRLALFASWGAMLTWVTVAFLTGLSVVLALVKSAGTPGLPSLGDLAAVTPAVALLAAEGALGLAIGWRLRSPLTAPGSALLVFLGSLLLYGNGPGQLIIVGGATDSLVGLSPRPGLQVAQVTFYVLFGIASIVLAAPQVETRRLNRASGPLALVLVVLAALVVVTRGGSPLAPRTTDLRCYGTGPTVCAGPGYARLLPEARTALLPYVAALERAGVVVPERFEQGQEPGTVTVAPLSIGLLGGRRDEAPLLLMAAYSRKDCDASNTDVLQTQAALLYWLTAQVDSRAPTSPMLPNVLRNGSPADQQLWVRQAVAVLQRCGR